MHCFGLTSAALWGEAPAFLQKKGFVCDHLSRSGLCWEKGVPVALQAMVPTEQVQTVQVRMEEALQKVTAPLNTRNPSVSLSLFLVLSSPAKTVVPFSCPLPLPLCLAPAAPGSWTAPRFALGLGLCSHLGSRQCLCGPQADWEKELIPCKPKGQMTSRNAVGGPPLIISLQSLPTDQPWTT